ncbi:alpha/beta fold hydrolase [Nocardioides pelophilus]|uniref:alpha/beta fold hydrolase n=1 Tax=Nocardioides pelophilus TaxID=2172019 RepID=UPI001601EABF|nr:alpha/beta hydrolase [Nocardioides pelophilus]
MSGLQTDHFRGGSGEPLVLLHPAVTTWRIWRPVIDRLTTHHDVFAPTLPGHHGGPPPPRLLTFGGLADAVEDLLDGAGIGRAHLAGNSLGAAAVLELARRGRAITATAIAPPGAWGTGWDRLLLEVKLVAAIRIASAPLPPIPVGSAVVRRAALAPLMVRGDRVPVDEVRQLLTSRRHSARFVVRLITGLRSEGHSEAPFAPGPCPTLVAWPQLDRVLPYRRYGSPFRTLLPQSGHVQLPRTGHVPMYDDPELVASTILSLTSPSAIDTAV